MFARSGHRVEGPQSCTSAYVERLHEPLCVVVRSRGRGVAKGSSDDYHVAGHSRCCVSAEFAADEIDTAALAVGGGRFEIHTTAGAEVGYPLARPGIQCY